MFGFQFHSSNNPFNNIKTQKKENQPSIPFCRPRKNIYKPHNDNNLLSNLDSQTQTKLGI